MVCVCMCGQSLQSYPALCDPTDCILQALLSMGFSRQEYWSGLPFPSPWYSLLKCINTWRGDHSLTIWWDCLHSVITAEPSVPHGQAQIGPWLAHSMIPEPKTLSRLPLLLWLSFYDFLPKHILKLLLEIS